MVFPIDSGKSKYDSGFTFVELMVVMAIIALLISIALPRYFDGLKHAKEAVLHEDLANMRSAIDHFYADKAVYPNTLDDLVNLRYLRFIPVDPVTERADTWQTDMPPDKSSHVYDVHSGSNDISTDGTPYSTW